MSEGFVELQLLGPILEYVPRCPIDSKRLDKSVDFIACPTCGVRICVVPCAEELAENDKNCPSCRSYKFGAFRDLLSNMKYLRNLEVLKTGKKITEAVYYKLREEYHSRIKELTGTVVIQ